ncbi:hypothetical protein [Azonexus fungiphilus]|uniref:hypothetical protein n=1 Tax=Azonexus fungiphilus TaxID=146940 RepID=UPI00147527DA|nr:hypothetical protein [Azonexus fungiphilus]
MTFGKQQMDTDQNTESTRASKSSVGSLEGDVTLLAGNRYRQVGSDVIVPKGNIEIAVKTGDIAWILWPFCLSPQTETSRGGQTSLPGLIPTSRDIRTNHTNIAALMFMAHAVRFCMPSALRSVTTINTQMRSDLAITTVANTPTIQRRMNAW